MLTWTASAGLIAIIFGLVIGVIPPPKHALADSSHIISVYSDGQKKVITSSASDVRSALGEAGVKLETGDSVDPGVDAKISDGFFNINVYRSRPVVVVDGAIRKTVQTSSQSPELIARAAGLTVYPEDTYAVATLNDITAAGTVGQEITIQRATPVVLSGDGTTETVRTQQKTVGGLLDERDVAFGPQDSVAPGRDTPITANLTVQINRVKVVVLKQTETIPHATQTVEDANLDAGVTKVQTPGKDGQKESTYRVSYQNGSEQGRVLLSQTVVSQPVVQVQVVGTKINYSSNPTELGKQLAAQRGWTGAQWDALYKLWSRESGWNPNARNGSGACGIPQAYPCSKIPDHSAAGQISWGLNYIAGRYGDPASAWAHWQRYNSY